MAGRSARLQPGEPEHRHDIGVVPLEGHGEGEHVEVAHRRLRLEGQQRLTSGEQSRELLLVRQEHAFTRDAFVGVEEGVDGLEAEIRHPDEVRIREAQRDAEAATVRLADESDLAGQRFAGLRVRIAGAAAPGEARGPGTGGADRHEFPGIVRSARLIRRRARGTWYFRLYLRLELTDGRID